MIYNYLFFSMYIFLNLIIADININIAIIITNNEIKMFLFNK